MNDELLRVEGLTYALGKDKTILDHLTFSIWEGSFTLLLGPNGAGKSTLLRIIKGLHPLKEGTIFLEGKDVSNKEKHRLRKIGLVFQDADSQFVGQSVEKDIRFGVENLALPVDEQNRRIDEVLHLLSMEEQRHRHPHTLSGGEKRKLAIAGVLVMQPKLILLDEPFANLDYQSIVATLKLLLRLQKNGHTIILVSHEIEKCLAHADHVLVLSDSLLVEDGSPKRVLPRLSGHGIHVPHDAPLEKLTWLTQ